MNTYGLKRRKLFSKNGIKGVIIIKKIRKAGKSILRHVLILGTIIAFFLIIFFLCDYFMGCAISDYQRQKAQEIEDTIVIDVPIPSTYGTVTIYDMDDVIYSYQGEMQILNDGTNGQPIEVVVDTKENNANE